MKETEEIAVSEMNDSGRVLDNDIDEWVSGWQKIFRLQKEFHIVNNRTTTVTADEYISEAVEISKYRKFVLFWKVKSNAIDLTIQYQHQYSLDGVDWYYDGAGSSSYTPLLSSGTSHLLTQTLNIDVTAKYYRLKVKSNENGVIQTDDVKLFCDSL